jgi:uncharacterized membrane protein
VGPLATHFDFAGKPNGFQSKPVYLLFFILMNVGINALFLTFFRWIDRLPESLVNIAHKDYWFSTPERKAEAFKRLRKVLCLSGIFLNGIFLICHQMVVQANNPGFFLRVPTNGLLGIVGAVTLLFLFVIFRMVKPPAGETR